MKIINIFQSGLYLNKIIALTEDGEVLCGKYAEQDNNGLWNIVNKIKWDKI